MQSNPLLSLTHDSGNAGYVRQIMKKHFAAGLAAVTLTSIALAVPLAAQAQSVPTYPAQYASEGQIRGRIASFDGGYNLVVRDERGYLDNVQMHQGTIINPTGLTLRAGMIVSVIGYNAGSFFGANEIDTPYTFDAGAPYYYGHPWFYYGPTFELGFFFGNPGWWHGGYFGGGYRWYAGVRVYENVRIGYGGWGHGWGYHGWGYHGPGYRDWGYHGWGHPGWGYHAGFYHAPGYHGFGYHGPGYHSLGYHGPGYHGPGYHAPVYHAANHTWGRGGYGAHGADNHARALSVEHFHGNPGGHAVSHGSWHPAAHSGRIGGGHAAWHGAAAGGAHGEGHGRR